MKNERKTESFSRKIVKILGVKVDSTSRERLLAQIGKGIEGRRQFYIVTPNPEIVLQAQGDPDLLKAINMADYSIPDGNGLRIAEPRLEIIKGRELMVDLLGLASERKLKVFFLGAQPKVNEAAVEKARGQFPGLKVKGNSGPMLDDETNPVSEVDINLQFEIINEINLYMPDILFVAFGAPRQEKWIYKQIKSKKLKVRCMMGVGGALDYYAGFVKKVPKIIEFIGLEWLWRLIQQPKRLPRIFNAVVVFPLRAILSGR